MRYPFYMYSYEPLFKVNRKRRIFLCLLLLLLFWGISPAQAQNYWPYYQYYQPYQPYTGLYRPFYFPKSSPHFNAYYNNTFRPSFYRDSYKSYRNRSSYRERSSFLDDFYESPSDSWEEPDFSEDMIETASTSSDAVDTPSMSDVVDESDAVDTPSISDAPSAPIVIDTTDVPSTSDKVKTTNVADTSKSSSKLEATDTSDCCKIVSPPSPEKALSVVAPKITSFLSSQQDQKKPKLKAKKNPPSVSPECLSLFARKILPYIPESPPSALISKCIQASMEASLGKKGTYSQCNRGAVKIEKGDKIPPCDDKEVQKVVSNDFNRVVKCTGEDPRYLFSLWNHESRFVPNITSGTNVIGIGQVAAISIETLNDPSYKYNPQMFFKKSSKSCQELKRLIKNGCDRLDPLKAMTYGALHVKSYRSNLENKLFSLKQEFQKDFPKIQPKMKKEVLTMSYNAGITLHSFFKSFVRINISNPHLINDIDAFVAFLKSNPEAQKTYKDRWDTEVKSFLQKVVDDEKYINQKVGGKCGDMVVI